MEPKTFTIGFSPCPNDTFIFYALMHGKISCDDFVFKQIFEDVERLNQMALESRLDISKVSYHALGYIRDEYCLLRSGGALGRGCGPIVIAREGYSMEDLEGKRIAVPGKYTTAFLLLQLCNPSLKERAIFIPFHRIIEAVNQGEADAGVIIHESRFTYSLHGLQEVVDLGMWWESVTGLPIPLGAIVAKRALGRERIERLECLIQSSIQYAFSNKRETSPYIKAHSQELSDQVIEKHIDLYVNNFSLDIGQEGEQACRTLMEMAEERNIFMKNDKPLFITKDSMRN